MNLEFREMVRNWIQSKTRPRRRSRRARFGPGEQLEDRLLLAADIRVVDGVLEVEGTEGNDRITIEEIDANRVRVNVKDANGTELTDTRIIAKSEFHLIRVEALGGGDEVLNYTTTADVINGGSGFDYIYAGQGNSVVNGGMHDDTIFGAAGDDVLHGNEGNDMLYGMADNDEMYGDEGDDVLEGGEGDDVINGGEGNDSLFGDGGDDEMHGDSGDDVVKGGSGINTGSGGQQTGVFLDDDGVDVVTGDEQTRLLSQIAENTEVELLDELSEVVELPIVKQSRLSRWRLL